MRNLSALHRLLAFSSALVVSLSTSLSLASREGGGSTTGGGHGLVCLRDSVADEVRSTLISNHVHPEHFVDPYISGRDQKIVSVSLFEGDEIAEYLSRDELPGNPAIGANVLGFLKSSLRQDATDLETHSGYDPKLRLFLSQAIRVFIREMDWTKSMNGIPFTHDFVAPARLAPNCVFAQLAKQTWIKPGHVRLYYDQKLLEKLPQLDGSFLSLHEAMYHLVMASPKYASLEQPSVFVRRLTKLIDSTFVLQRHGGLPNEILRMLQQIGYLENLTRGTPSDYPDERSSQPSN